MMERLKLKTLGLDLLLDVVSAFGKFASISCNGLWTIPTAFIHRTMNSTTMCLLPGQIGEGNNDNDSTQCANVQYNIVASGSPYAAD